MQAIVLAAEEPSRIRGGALLGGRGGPMDNFVGEATKYVVVQGAVPGHPDRAAVQRRPGHGALDPEQHPTPAGDAAPAHDQSISAAPPLRERPSP